MGRRVKFVIRSPHARRVVRKEKTGGKLNYDSRSVLTGPWVKLSGAKCHELDG